MIKVRYTTIDGVNKLRTFKTLKSARKFAMDWVGPQDVEGGHYAVSDDGVGKVTWWGCSRAQLFGDEPKGGPPEGKFKIYTVEPSSGGNYHTTRAEAEAELLIMIKHYPDSLWRIEEREVTKEDFS